MPNLPKALLPLNSITRASSSFAYAVINETAAIGGSVKVTQLTQS